LPGSCLGTTRRTLEILLEQKRRQAKGKRLLSLQGKRWVSIVAYIQTWFAFELSQSLSASYGKLSIRGKHWARGLRRLWSNLIAAWQSGITAGAERHLQATTVDWHARKRSLLKRCTHLESILHGLLSKCEGKDKKKEKILYKHSTHVRRAEWHVKVGT